jgi:hypothetical protein
MKQDIKNLTLLLLYLTHWQESGLNEPIYRSWKGYPWEALDALNEEGLISQSKRAKSVCLTADGIKKAKGLKRKFKISDVS